MSIEIPNDRPLTEEEREHLLIWNPRRLEVHEKRFPQTEEKPPGVNSGSDDNPDVPPYLEWSVKDLLEEIRVRNLEMPTKGKTKADLAAVLDADDEKNAEKSPEE